MIPSFCISHCPKRRAIADAHFSERGISPQYIQAVHGDTWGITSTIVYGLDGTDYKIEGKHVGIILTHWMIWQHLRLSGIEEALILEDDADLVPDFVEKFHHYRGHLPDDWQFVLVGYLESPDWIGKHKTLEVVSPYVFRGKNLFGTHCYLVRQDGLQTLLDTNQIAWAPIDIQIDQRSLPHLRHYALAESLAVQRAD